MPYAWSTDHRVLRLPSCTPRSDRPADFADDVSFSPELVEAFVELYTQPSDLVFDPFAGFGTTLRVAQAMGRRALGLEIDADRIAFFRDSLVDPSAARLADVRSIDWTSVPRFDLSISSPPYMTAHDHPQNPLSGYRTMDGDYRTYLADLTQIYRAVSSRAAGPDARVVVNVANLNSTRLAWDVGTALAEVLTFEREVIVDQEAPEPSFTQDYCLVFRPGIELPSHADDRLSVEEFSRARDEETVTAFLTHWVTGDSAASVAHLADHDEGGGTTLIAWQGDRIVGLVTLRWISNDPGFAARNIPLVHQLTVHPDVRRRGTADQLMQAAEALSRGRGYDTLGVTVGLFDTYGLAQRLYARRGYLPDGRGACLGPDPVRQGDEVRIDHDLILWLTKDLDS